MNLFRIGIIDLEIEVSKKLMQIYSKPAGFSAGPNPDQYRDCTDIAVKLAFGLNKLGTPINDLESLDIVQEISNSLKINQYIPEYTINPIRIRQASDDNIRKEFNVKLTNIKQQIKSIENYPNSTDKLLDEVRDNNKKIFDKIYVPEKYVNGIKDITNTYIANSEAFALQLNDEN